MTVYKRYILPECNEHDRKGVMKLKSHTERIKELLGFVDITVDKVLGTTCPLVAQNEICNGNKVYEYTYRTRLQTSCLLEVTLDQINNKALEKLFK